MDQLQPLIITALICLIVGFGLGYLAGSGQTAKEDRREGGEIPVRSPTPQPVATPVAPRAAQLPLPPQAAVASPAQVAPRPSLNPVDALARALQPGSARPEAPKSIAAQVDEILQEKLAQTSPPETRAIRLVEGPEQGVVVVIGRDSYEGVESVPDPTIRDLIRASVREWEQRTF